MNIILKNMDHLASADNKISQSSFLDERVTRTDKKTIEGAASAQKIEVVPTEERKTSTARSDKDPIRYVINDDFSPQSPLEKIGNFFRTGINEFKFYTNSSHRAVPSEEGTKDKIVERSPGGSPGLTNNFGECGFNATLQLLKPILQQMMGARAAAGAEGDGLLEGKPYFKKFLNNEISTDADCRKLRIEAAEILAEDDLTTRFQGGRVMLRDIHPNTLTTGCINGAFPAPLLKVLLYRFYAPPMVFKQESKDLIGRTRTTYHSTQMLEIEGQPPSSLDATIESIIDSDLVKKGRVLAAPPPPFFVVDLSHARSAGSNIVRVTEPITLLEEHGKNITYQPKAIQCGVAVGEGDSHGFTFVRENDEWIHFNDQEVHALGESWQQHFEPYCSHHAYLIVYEKNEVSREKQVASPALKPSSIIERTNRDAYFDDRMFEEEMKIFALKAAANGNHELASAANNLLQSFTTSGDCCIRAITAGERGNETLKNHWVSAATAFNELIGHQDEIIATIQNEEQPSLELLQAAAEGEERASSLLKIAQDAQEKEKAFRVAQKAVRSRPKF